MTAIQSQGWCGRAGVLAGAVLVLVLVLAHTSHAGPITKRNIDSLLEGKDKRPFCNAFTGCGRKRADPQLDTAAASGSELDALAKHVLAEAKLWEQLQNKMDMMRTLAARMDTHPLYRRKRSPTYASSTQPDSPPTHKLEEGKQE